MADFLMPSLGADMEAGTVLQWLVKPGDAVKRGDIVAVVDTEKATIEVEIFQTGVIQKIVVPEGAKVPVGTLLAVLAVDGEVAAAAPEAKPKPVERAPVVPAPTAPTPPAAARIVAKAAPQPAAPHRARISPLAMRIAMELKVDLAAVKGTGPEGAITKADVERAAKAPPTPAPAPRAAAPIEEPSTSSTAEARRRTDRSSCGDAQSDRGGDGALEARDTSLLPRHSHRHEQSDGVAAGGEPQASGDREAALFRAAPEGCCACRS